MKNIVIIGTSKIAEEHIKCLLDLNFKILAICSTRKKSKNLHVISRKYKIQNYFDNFLNLQKFLEGNKDFAFFLAPRIKDTENILSKCLKYKKKIFIEKPITNKLSFIDKIKKYKNYIFVGYNRIFYKNISFIKKEIYNKKNLFIEVTCPENDKKKIQSNTCHVISILLFLFNKIKIIKIQRNTNYIFVIAKIKSNGLVTLRFNFNSSENFSIKIIDSSKMYKLRPIETLKVFNGMELLNKTNFTNYKPILIKKIEEYKINNFKPGFYVQAKEFKKFLNNNHYSIINSIEFAREVIDICNTIYDKKFNHN